MENPTKGSGGAEKCSFHTRLAQGTHPVGGTTSLQSGEQGFGSPKPTQCLERTLSVPPAAETNASCTRDTKENIHWLRGWGLPAGFTGLRQESRWSLLLGGVLAAALLTAKGRISAWPQLPHTGAIFFEKNTHLLDIKRTLSDQTITDTKSDACSMSRRLPAAPGASSEAAGALAIPAWTLHVWHGSALTHTLQLPSINTYSPNSLSKAALPQPKKQFLGL